MNNIDSPAYNYGMLLVNWLLSMGLALAISVLAVHSYITLHRHSLTQMKKQQTFRTLQFAANYLRERIRQTGYLGDTLLSSKLGGALGGSHSARCTGINWSYSSRVFIQGLDHSQAQHPCFTQNKPAKYLKPNDSVSLRYADAYPAVSVYDQQLYLKSSVTTALLLTGATQNEPINTITPPFTLRRWHSDTYYIGLTRNARCRNQSLPGLVHLYRSNRGRLRQEMIIQGVEYLDLLYAERPNNQAAPVYVSAREVNNWNNVIGVRYWIITRAVCPDPAYRNTQSYQLGNRVITVNDRFHRASVRETVHLRNPDWQQINAH